MSNIVTIINGIAVTTSLAIAEGTENDHASVIKLVRTYQSDLEEFGLLDFKSESTGGRPTEYAVLNEQQSTLLLTYMRNSDIVRAFKKQLVKAFFELANQQKTEHRKEKPATKNLPPKAKDVLGCLLLLSKEIGKLPGADKALVMAATMNDFNHATGIEVKALSKALPSPNTKDVGMLKLGDIGKRVGLSATMVGRKLTELGLREKSPEGEYVLTKLGEQHAQLFPYQNNDNGHSGYDTRWKESVLSFFNTDQAEAA